MSFSSQTGGYTRIYLMIMGAIFLVVGLGVALFLGNLPYAGGGMLLMGVIFAVVGGGLLIAGFLVGRNVTAQNQIMQTGISGMATITGLTQTGVYVNEQPQIKMNLLVQLPGETAYATNHTEIVPLMMLGRLSNGQPLAVRVDQMDRSKLVIDWSGNPMATATPAYGAVPMTGMAGMPMPVAAMAGMPGAPMAPGQTDESLAQVQAALAGTGGMPVANMYSQPGQQNYTVEQLRAYLRQNGLQATAHIDKLDDTGQTVGDEHVFKMEMTLNIPGQSPQKLPASAAMVPVAKASKIAEGMDLPVRYAAENHDLLMVEWDKI